MKIANKLLIIVLVAVYMLPQQIISQISVSPNDFAGLRIWLTGDSCKVNSSSVIDTVYDLSTYHNHAIQTNSSLQPKRSASNLNGHKSILFDGIDDYVIFNAVNNIRTIFWVLKDNNTPSTNLRPLLGHSVNYPFHRGFGGELYATSLADAAITNGQTKLNKAQINGEAVVLPNQYSIISLATTANISAEFFSRDRANTARVWDGELLELIIYDTLLSTANIAHIEDYLNNKYAPSVKLPNDTTIYGFCDINIAPVNSLNNQHSLVWYNGSTANNILMTSSRKVWVDAVNIFGVHSSDTMIVTLQRPNYFKLTDTAICKSNTLLWNTYLPKSNYTFKWQDNSTDSTFNITQAGNYYVKITDAYGCSATTDTVKITQDNFAITTSLGPDVSLCSGNLITLSSGASPTHSYIWSTGSTTDSLLITNTGQYSVIVTNTNNCVAKDTINVNVIGQAPIANFSTNIGCVGQTVLFTNSSVPASGNTIDQIYWNFGDPLSATNSSTLANSSHTYTNTGTYTVSLKVVANTSCEQSITKIINVYPVPTATFVSGTSCQNDSTAFINQSVGTSGYSVTSSFWNFGDGTTSNLTAPKHIFSNSLIYSVVLTVANSVGCKNSVSKSVSVQAQVSADFTTGNTCTNAPVNFQSTSIAPSNSSYNWNFGSSISTLLNPTKTYANSGVYSATLHVDGNNGCTSSITKFINVYLPPITSFSIPSLCSQDTVTAINSSNSQSGVIASYDWRLNNSPFSVINSPTISLSAANTYSVKLSVTNSFGCKDSLTKSFVVFPLPLVDFTTNPAAFYYINEPINFNSTITNANSYLWNITGKSIKTTQNFNEIFNAQGVYTVSLNLQDQHGCRNSKTKNITVVKRYLDLAILNVNTLKDNNGFMTVIADMANYGSVPISTIDLHYQISDAGNIKETWNGTLNPNSFFSYTFVSKSASSANTSNNITCVDIEKINTIIDENVDNNSYCNSLNMNDISVSDPLPNPAEDDIILPIILNRDLDYTVVIYNNLGKLLYEENTKKGFAGLNFIPLSTSTYARGSYIIKVIIDDKIFIKKFIKIDNH